MSIGIGIIGTGTVGSGVLEILTTRTESLSRAAGTPLKVARVAARFEHELAPWKALGIPVTTEVATLLDDPEVHIVVELAGGYDLPRAWVTQALERGKSVVTANKAMLAKHGGELFPLAAKNGAELRFEAAVGGAIPIIRALREAFIASDVNSLACIINGTSNYILTRMFQDGMGFEQALKEAQAAGYAEADPTFDVEGIDAAHKVALMATLCGGRRVDFEKMRVEGISQITAADVAGAKELGCVIRLLGLVEVHPTGVDARVHPCLVPQAHPLAGVNGAMNAVFLDGSTTGPSMLYGKGAGKMPTASAVVADIVDVAGILHRKSPVHDLSWFGGEEAPLFPTSDVEGPYYLRLQVGDKPGVLARIAKVLGDSGISVSRLIQHEAIPGAEGVTMVVDTHVVREGALLEAIARIDALPETVAPTVVLRFYEKGVGA
ncbi:MAG: homoserine dehydrogenase [Fibrobacteria bacterium]|nr:homoserine dehydrogenase [Fibrobacteria bacterium]